ncbi:MAG TPA: 16S rRNA (adenine(1518)-N(6)/adenine(1519)-N(6))-dimethyltransferase RsmA [Candidatus Thalassarchaeaceae archaeon]|jgi:16S rRNA (adenine1518-N6/adenine1519-N6)-dimethyltransferase|nr:16S rRNA (adenine(1518)-N(6)/adenine(1519)-N(6))-dimethyltransferase RsmA [Candidatus Thalassarchaeaceae archaeon]
MDDLDVRLLVDLLRDRINPDRALGQHFLLDENVISRAVNIAGKQSSIDDSSHVLEIGPGPGSLTLELLRTGARVTALEVDAESVSHLNRVFLDVENRLEVRLIDALEADWPEDITHIVSNLPYQISSPILERIQRHHAIFPLRGIALLVQDEFAERMAMIGGHANRGPLGHSLWLQFDVDLDSRVPPHSFSPAPRVHSRLVSLMPVNRLEINNIDNRLYRMVVSECFANRRRKLRTLLSKSPKRLNRIPGWHRTRWSNSIRQIPPQTLELRPENLTSVEWAELIEIISSE